MNDFGTDTLRAALAERSDPAVQQHWQRYLKGEAEFIGVPMAGVRATVTQFWRDGLAGVNGEQQRRIFAAWAAQPYTEERLAAVLLIAERLADDLVDDDLAMLAQPLSSGTFADWNIVDWYSTKALAKFVAGGDRNRRCSDVLAWANSDQLWQRRAAVVSFVPHAQQPRDFLPDLPEQLLPACDGNIQASTERFAHTGVGWLLREMSTAEPDLVADYVASHPELSAEARRMATAKLRPGPYRRR
jgi:3-methyladenine DNA glycosylase AlkD